MLASYHLMFTAASIILFFIGIWFLFIWNKKYDWATMIGFIILGLNIAICWISRIGFHGIQVIGYNGADFEVYTYPEMWALNVFPWVMVLISLGVMLVAALMQIGLLANEVEKPMIRLPNNDRSYWKKK